MAFDRNLFLVEATGAEFSTKAIRYSFEKDQKIYWVIDGRNIHGHLEGSPIASVSLIGTVTWTEILPFIEQTEIQFWWYAGTAYHFLLPVEVVDEFVQRIHLSLIEK